MHGCAWCELGAGTRLGPLHLFRRTRARRLGAPPHLRIILVEQLRGKTRSSAQGNCSAKSLAGDVINSSLSSLSFTRHANTNPGGGSRQGGPGWGEGEGGPGGGTGDISSTLPCTALPHGSCPKGTSHNNARHQVLLDVRCS